MKKLNKKGFTLVELLAVIVILALLMVVAFNVIPNIQGNARATAMETEAKKMESQVLEDYNLSLVDTTKTTYTYSASTTIVEDTTTAITFTEGNYIMYATVADGKIDAYCITDGTGAMVNGGDYTAKKDGGECDGAKLK